MFGFVGDLGAAGPLTMRVELKQRFFRIGLDGNYSVWAGQDQVDVKPFAKSCGLAELRVSVGMA
jgi:hypothetical protein